MNSRKLLALLQLIKVSKMLGKELLRELAIEIGYVGVVESAM